MPNLLSRPRLVFAILRVTLCYGSLKLIAVPKLSKIKGGLRGREYRSLLGEITVVRVVKGILYEVPDKHFDILRRFSMLFQVVGRHGGVVDVFNRVIPGHFGVKVKFLGGLSRRRCIGTQAT